MSFRNIYSIPDLSTKEIISYLAELNISISPTDILKPSFIVTQAIYDSILELFDGVEEMHGDESLVVIKQVQRMGCFLTKIGINNFTIRDLMPDSRRFIQILSTVCNFGMFRDNKKQVYEQAARMIENNTVEKRNLEKKIDSMKDQMEKTQKSLEENSKIKKTLEEEVTTLEVEFKKFYKEQKDKMSEASQLKAEKIEIGDKLCSCQLLEHNLKQEITVLKSQIVSDPTKLLELVEEMRILIEKEREENRQIDRVIQENETKLAKLNKSEQQMEALVTLVNNIASLDESIEKHDQGILICDGKIKNWDSNINALKIRINHIERQISHLETKIFNLQAKDKRVSEEISSKINNLKNKYEDMNTERESMVSKIKETNKKIQEIMFEKAQKTGEHERNCSEISGLLVTLNGKIDTYFNDLENLL